MQRSDYKVIAQYLVRGPDRSSTGHSFYFCAGRGWSKTWLQVNVVDGDKNPVEEYDEYIDGKPTGQKQTRIILDMITQTQLEELRADDGNIVVRPIHQGAGEANAEGVDVPALVKRNAEQEAEIAKLKGENERLKKNLSETNALLEQATKPAQELVRKVSGRRATG
jgi:hypothetical protein